MKITKFQVNGEETLVAESALDGQLLPPPSAEDVGKVPTVQEDGSYALSQSGGGTNVLTLYFSEPVDGRIYAYKDSDLTEGYTSYAEARDALEAADTIKLKQPNSEDVQESLWAYRTLCQYANEGSYSAQVSVIKNGTPLDIYLVYRSLK